MLEAALLAGRLLLAAVFATAGAAKLADREGARQAAVEFGTPPRFAGPLAFALPLAELAVAAALLPAGSALWGAVGALSMLAAFTVAIAVNLALGRTPDCHCFGQLHSAPAGARVLARNLALAGVAAAVVIAGWGNPGPDAVTWISGLEGAELAAAVAVVVAFVFAGFATWAFLHVMRSYGRVLLRLDRLESALAAAGIELEDEGAATEEFGLPVGVPAPQFAIGDLSGRTVELSDLVGDLPAVLIFAEPGCGPCQALMPQIAEWQREHADVLAVAVVSAGRRADVQAEAEEHELGLVLLDEERRVFGAFEVAGTPSAVLIRADTTIGSGLAAGASSIERLVERALTSDEPESALRVGDPAPALRLRDLDGRDRSLTRLLRGKETIVLFWNPDCGFCREMHDELLEWEGERTHDRRELVVVSSGDTDAVRAERFMSPVLLDPDFTAGASFGAGGTPSAVLVDAGGRIASRVVAGAEDVFALTRIPRMVMS